MTLQRSQLQLYLQTVTTSSHQCWKQFSACRVHLIVLDSPRNQCGLIRTVHRTIYHEGMDGHNRLETKDSTHINRGYGKDKFPKKISTPIRTPSIFRSGISLTRRLTVELPIRNTTRFITKHTHQQKIIEKEVVHTTTTTNTTELL